MHTKIRVNVKTKQIMFLQMIGCFGEFERKIINERTKGRRIATAKNNKYAGGQVPYGYEVRDGKIKEDTERAEIVRIQNMLTLQTYTGKSGYNGQKNIMALNKRMFILD